MTIRPFKYLMLILWAFGVYFAIKKENKVKAVIAVIGISAACACGLWYSEDDDDDDDGGYTISIDLPLGGDKEKAVA